MMMMMITFNWRWTIRACVYLVTVVHPVFCSCDLDFDPITLKYKSDLDILQLYTYVSKMNFLGHGFQKLQHQ